jgi:hypothetical protein
MTKLRKSRHARLAATFLAVGVFASLASVGYAAGLVPFVHTSPTAAQYPTSKVTICHHTHSQKNPFVTITVSQNALKAHLGNHGDTVGPCPQTGTTGATGAAGPVIIATNLAHKGKGKAKGHQKAALHATVKSHGHGHANGHSSTHGHGNSQGHGHANGHSSTHGHGHANGHSSTHGHGNSQGHGHDKSQSHGHGHGHGPSATHGNSGGNGKGHKH